MRPKYHADLDFSGPSSPGLPPIGVSADEERFARWDVFAHTEAANAPGVYRVMCGLRSEPDADGRRSLVESTIMILEASGAEVARRINLHVKD